MFFSFFPKSIRIFWFLITIRNYFCLENFIFLENSVGHYFALVFRKFAKQTKSAVIPCYFTINQQSSQSTLTLISLNFNLVDLFLLMNQNRNLSSDE